MAAEVGQGLGRAGSHRDVHRPPGRRERQRAGGPGTGPASAAAGAGSSGSSGSSGSGSRSGGLGDHGPWHGFDAEPHRLHCIDDRPDPVRSSVPDAEEGVGEEAHLDRIPVDLHGGRVAGRRGEGGGEGRRNGRGREGEDGRPDRSHAGGAGEAVQGEARRPPRRGGGLLSVGGISGGGISGGPTVPSRLLHWGGREYRPAQPINAVGCNGVWWWLTEKDRHE